MENTQCSSFRTVVIGLSNTRSAFLDLCPKATMWCSQFLRISLLIHVEIVTPMDYAFVNGLDGKSAKHPCHVSNFDIEVYQFTTMFHKESHFGDI